MNKDVIYIEPEDDITDIINRIKTAKQKVVALVPPKKLGVLRSAVNTKLIAKTAKSADKAVVMVTTDQSLIKLSATAGIPIAKTLQSRPVMPEELEDAPTTQKDEDVIDENDESSAEEQADSTAGEHSENSDQNSAKKDDATELNSEELEQDQDKKDKKDKKKNKNAKVPALEKYRKWIIIGAVAVVFLIGFLIWAMFIAPSAKITATIRTTSNSFAENVTFTTDANAKDNTAGKFFLEEQKVEDPASTEFTATGKKDVGDKAKGSLTLVAILKESTTGKEVTVSAGTTFTTPSSLAFTTDKAITFSTKGETGCSADDYSDGAGCRITATVPATASDVGDKYNIPANTSWNSPVTGVTASNPNAFSGGSTKEITVVQQSDVDAAKTKLETSGDGKAKLEEKFKDMLAIDSSYKQSAGNLVSTPAVGEEVKDGVTPKLSITTTYSMFGVDKTALDEFITKKVGETLASDQKIYSTGNPFLERFTDNNGNYSAKLKTTYQTGPKVTEEEILEKVKGQKVGRVVTLLKSINGISNVNVDTSFFWVGTIPTDDNRITIDIKQED